MFHLMAILMVIFILKSTNSITFRKKKLLAIARQKKL